ncbi:hypothetical protein APR41_17730 [Salegentibacter salinarum]|uniref:Uncharacterized protein n=1 Tax=Salegentibacter salinarum TaxID=447422 RepID=A0A2N0TVK2_9FLAO|nr:hypothetical protein [Salegentibacter salinarum]PKD18749.1 hypothetical protein APR41_17730 [Salegentibacter salinarum]SKB98471.1 hypothetical protein SAMN05660903_03627 [Salegentibacter salinarum]
MEEQGAFKEVPFHDEFRKEVIDKLLELHRQLVLLEHLERGSRMPFLRKIAILRDFFGIQILKNIYTIMKVLYIYNNLERLMEKT